MTRIRIVWPGKTKNRSLRELEATYLARIRQLEPCDLVEVKDGKGLAERDREKIMELEAKRIETQFAGAYLICLSDKGRELNSEDFARLLERKMSSSPGVTFVLGGFAGLAERILRRANMLLSLSRMTLSHELARVVLLEQIYRAISIQRGRRYAK